MPIKILKKSKGLVGVSFFLKKSAVFGALFFVTISCESSICDQTINFENGKWQESNPVTFKFEIKDTAKQYDIFLEVNHGTDYGHQNFYCLVESYSPLGLAQRQVNSLELSSKKGKWTGICNSETCNRKIPFITRSVFDIPGSYKIRLTQYSRKNPLAGINSLRLIVEQTK
jgi:gliding motility-associated lipoprotein GldH